MAISCVVFILLLCIVVSVASYFMISRTLYSVYEEKMGQVISHVEPDIDYKGLKGYLKTIKNKDDGMPSSESIAFAKNLEKLIGKFNSLVDSFGLDSIYIVTDKIGIDVDGDEEPDEKVMTRVISSVPAEARDREGATALFDGYSAKDAQHFKTAWKPDKISYFEKQTENGKVYTACKPLKSEKGKTFALLCVDIPIGSLHGAVVKSVAISTVIILIAGAVFCAILIFWLNYNVTAPVLALAESAKSYAEKNTDVKDPDLLTFYPPDIKTGNEIELLAGAMTKMSEDMKKYVERITTAEQRADKAEAAVSGMNKLAYQDPLTRVRSKRAFAETVQGLDEAIKEGGARFAVIKIDLDDVDMINRTYGLDKGDAYILGACGLITSVCGETKVYRIRGDVFAIVLDCEEDFADREKIQKDLEDKFASIVDDPESAPWERYGASIGMAEFIPGEDKGADDVLLRADKNMKHGE